MLPSTHLYMPTDLYGSTISVNSVARTELVPNNIVYQTPLNSFTPIQPAPLSSAAQPPLQTSNLYPVQSTQIASTTSGDVRCSVAATPVNTDNDPSNNDKCSTVNPNADSECNLQRICLNSDITTTEKDEKTILRKTESNLKFSADPMTKSSPTRRQNTSIRSSVTPVRSKPELKKNQVKKEKRKLDMLKRVSKHEKAPEHSIDIQETVRLHGLPVSGSSDMHNTIQHQNDVSIPVSSASSTSSKFCMSGSIPANTTIKLSKAGLGALCKPNLTAKLENKKQSSPNNSPSDSDVQILPVCANSTIEQNKLESTERLCISFRIR